MDLFSRRPLATGSILLMLSAFLLMRATDAVLLPLLLLAAALFLLLLCFLFALGFEKRRLFLFICCLCFLLSVFSVFRLRQAEQPLTDAVGSRVTAALTVEEVVDTAAGGATLLVRVDSLEGEDMRARAILLTAYPSPYLVGDTLEGEFEVSALEMLGFGSDFTYYYRGLGAAVVLESDGADAVTLTKSANSTKLAAAGLRHIFAGRIESVLTGEEGALLQAMLLGERDTLFAATTKNFKFSGVAHLLALSGLHLGILVVATEGILLLFRVRHSTRRALVLAFLLFFLFLTGFSFSLLRAALMLLSLYIGFSFWRDSDSLTALSLAGAVIVCISPFAVFSTSFQMTVLATFGLLAFGRANGMLLYRLTGKREEAGFFTRLFSFIISSLLVSFSASFAVLVVQWMTFGEFSLVTPLANLLLVPLATLLLPLGILLAAFPLPVLALPVSLIANAMLRIAALLARWDAVVSLRFAFVPYLLLPALAATLFLLGIKLKRRRRPLVLVPMLAFALAFALCFGIHYTLIRERLAVTYAGDGKNESISLLRGGDSMLIDLSGGSRGQLYTGWMALKNGGATSLDLLVLTHYHTYHGISVPRFFHSVAVREIWVPMPRTEAEVEILSRIYAAAAEHGSEVVLMTENTALSVFGDGTLTFAASPPEKDGEGAVFLSLTLNGKTLVYKSASISPPHDAVDSTLSQANADILILGTHGVSSLESVRFSAPEGATVILGDHSLLPLLEIQKERQYLLPKNGAVRFYLQ